MTCKKCGANFEGTTCPSCGATQKQKKPLFKKWWFWLIIGIVVISIISSGDNEPAPTPATPGSTSSTTATPVETTAPADPFYHVGDVIDANGLKITYVKAEKHKEKNKYSQPEDGYMYIKLYLSVENTSESDCYISSFEFECYADGKKQETYYTSEGTLEGGTLSSGRKDEGYIYFTVPEDAKDIEVEYETNFWSDKKAILKVELS